jgi:hypothetical protein
MPWQLFGTLAGGNQPASLFDTLSGQIANCVIIPCACGGSANAIALTPATGTSTPPNISSYVNFMCFAFVAATNSTGNVALQAFGLASLPLYTAGGTSQAGSGAIVAGSLYIVAFQSSLNSNNGGFVIVSAQASTLAIPVTLPQGGTGFTSTTAFAVICGGTSGTNPLQPIASVGNLGQVLTSNGPGALPSMQNVVAGFNLLATLTASNSATLSDTTHITSTYNVYAFVLENVLPVTNTQGFLMRVSENGGSSYIATNYVSTAQSAIISAGITWAAAPTGGFDFLATGFLLSGTPAINNGPSNGASGGLSGIFYFTNPNSAAFKQVWGNGAYLSGAGSINPITAGGIYNGDTNVINAVQFLFQSGNISSGKIRVYGVSA